MVMAGFDKIDPANPCLGCDEAVAHACQGLQILAERLYNFLKIPAPELGVKNGGGRRTWPRGDPEW